MAPKPTTKKGDDPSQVVSPLPVSEAHESALVKVDIEPMTVAPAALRERMAVETEKRKVLTDYISANMVEGKDYGKIMIRGQESKPTLFKPGAEKFCSLFGLQATFKKDTDTWEMLGSQQGCVAFICELKTKGGAIVGEGRGVASMTERQNWSANNCVKIAEKRAQIDAVLRSGGLSDFFTQDLEDQPEAQPARPTGQLGGSSTPYTGKLSDAQLRMIFSLMKQAGKTKEEFEAWLLKAHSVIGIENMPKQLASIVIDGLLKKHGKPTSNAAHPEEVPTIQLEEKGEELPPLDSI